MRLCSGGKSNDTTKRTLETRKWKQMGNAKIMSHKRNERPKNRTITWLILLLDNYRVTNVVQQELRFRLPPVHCLTWKLFKFKRYSSLADNSYSFVTLCPPPPAPQAQNEIIMVFYNSYSFVSIISAQINVVPVLMTRRTSYKQFFMGGSYHHQRVDGSFYGHRRRTLVKTNVTRNFFSYFNRINAQK